MSLTIRQYNCRFRSRRRPFGLRTGYLRRCPDSTSASVSTAARSTPDGYALLLVMLTVTVLLVSLAAVLPSVRTEAQREREEELIFRGNEYARAIALFHNRFARYPNSVDELLKKTNGVRFLRRVYKDPMSKDGKWRFIHANAAGMLLDSKTTAVQAGPGVGGSNTPLGGNTSGSGGQFGGAGGGMFGQSSTTSASSPTSGQPPPAGDTQAQSGDASQSQPGQGTEQSSSFLGGNQTLSGAGLIAGVASSSKKRSIRVWNQKKRYDEWEFLGLAVAPGGSQLGGMPGGTAGAPSAPGVGTAPSGPGQSTSPPQPTPTQPTPQPPTAPPTTDQPAPPPEGQTPGEPVDVDVQPSDSPDAPPQ